MRRIVFFAVLSLLLLSMQHESYVHPLAHLAGRAPAPHETVLTATHADADCVECALLAGGFNAVHASPVLLPSEAPPAARVFRSYRSRAAEVPAWFQSRAPPVLV